MQRERSSCGADLGIPCRAMGAVEMAVPLDWRRGLAR
jgi:hypothetical protein